LGVFCSATDDVPDGFGRAAIAGAAYGEAVADVVGGDDGRGYLFRAAGGIRLVPGGQPVADPCVAWQRDRQGASAGVLCIMVTVSARSRRTKVPDNCPIFFLSALLLSGRSRLTSFLSS